VGSDWARPGVLLPGMRPQPGNGYDGQFYFYLAQDPFLTRPDTARSLDNTFRVRRIAYPLLGWALSAGRRQAVPYVLIGINVAAATALVGLAAAEAARRGRRPWWALCLALYAGVWIPVLLALTEPLQLALLAAGMTAGSAGLLLLAALAKATAGVALATEAARAALGRDWPRAARHATAAALLLAWALAVFGLVQGPRFDELGPHFLQPPGAPFRQLLGAPARALIELPALLLCLAALARLVRSRDGAALAAAAYAVLALGAGDDTWLDPAAYYRVTAGVLVLSFLSWCRSGDRLGSATLALAALSGLFEASLLLS